MHDLLTLRFKKIHPYAVTPEYKTPGAAAFDLGIIEDVTIPARSLIKVRTGLVIQIPEHYVLLIASRSSNAPKRGISMANGIGVIDSDYRGPNDEIHLVIQNLTDVPVVLQKGDRVAQGLVLPVPAVTLEEITDEIAEPDRGGFGTTGK